MRKVVAIEGISTIDGRFIMPQALEPAHRAYIPVVQLNDDAPIGMATEFMRIQASHGGYEISFEMHFRNDVDLPEAEDCTATIFVTSLDTEMGKNGELLIKKGIIRAITLVSDGYWPWRVR